MLGSVCVCECVRDGTGPTAQANTGPVGLGRTGPKHSRLLRPTVGMGPYGLGLQVLEKFWGLIRCTGGTVWREK